MHEKTCTKCGQVKPFDGFTRKTASKDGRDTRCRDCIRQINAAYFAANPERCRQNMRKWRAENAETVREKQHAKYLANAERTKTKVAARLAAMTPEQRAARGRAGKGALRARRFQVEVVEMTPAEMEAVLAEPECVYCGAPTEQADHVRPFIHGGWHHVSNVVPSCQPCNFSKSTKLLAEWDAVKVARAVKVSTKVSDEWARQRASKAS